MRKFIKYFLISLSSLIGLLMIAIGILFYIVFTPERITPIINNQVQKMLTADFEIKRAELTLIKTFPNFGIKISDFSIINPMEGAYSDTLISVESFTGSIDLMAFIKENEIIVSEIFLENGYINGFIDKSNNNNFDVFITDTTKPKEVDDSEFNISLIDLQKFSFNNINLKFIDDYSGISTKLANLTAEIKANYHKDEIVADIILYGSELLFADKSTAMETGLKKVRAEIQANYIDFDNIQSEILLQGHQMFFKDDTLMINTSGDFISSKISFEKNKNEVISDLTLVINNSFFAFNEDIYLDSVDINMHLPSVLNISEYKFDMESAFFALGDVGINISGPVEYNIVNGDISTNLKVDFSDLEISDILGLVPELFQPYLMGMQGSGKVSSDISVDGIFNDSLMPVADINFTIKEGTLTMPDLPLPLSNIYSHGRLFTDFFSDDITFLDLYSFKANTPLSEIKTSGKITNIFSDLHQELVTSADFNLEEINMFMPEALNASASGKVKAEINSTFLLSQLMLMDIDNIKLDGVITSDNLNITLDTLNVVTEMLSMNFALPNNKEQQSSTDFLYLDFNSDMIELRNPNRLFANIKNFSINLETSNIMDTTHTPDIIGTFSLDNLSAVYDTIDISITKPKGDIKLVQQKAGERMSLDLIYSSDELNAKFGSDSFSMDKISLSADIINDPNKEDVFSQWDGSGQISLNNGVFKSDMLNHNLLIPEIKLDFDSENFNIHESRLIIDKSDFRLSGAATNIMSHFRYDSIIRAEFNFVSEFTDILQLMTLTSGIGVSDEELIEDDPKTKPDSDDNNNDIEETFSGPYIVPQGVDLKFTTQINKASYGQDTVVNVLGDLVINDGVLVLDNMRFTSPAARMQLTAMYRTPRKNHLYLGLDYHMLDIEIEELLRIIPDIDSLMPMLRSFRGKGEFHLAVECYMDSTYNVKLSTLRGASSITGQNLVLLDGETFSEIARKLRFSRGAENVIDSLSVEFTIFREQIDIFPFLIVMDRYGAVVVGRHNFDMSFDYHISLVRSPLPIRLGMNILGDFDAMSFRLARTRYPELYRPDARGAVQSSQLQLRNVIRQSLTNRVLESE